MTERAPDKSKEPVILLPGTLTDFAKALRELIGAIRDFGSLVKDGVGLYDKHQARNAAKHLNALSFAPEGSRRHLERIAAGKGTATDLEAIGTQMAATAQEVETSIRALGSHRKALRENHGMAAAMKLDEIIYGPVGKKMLRMSLLKLVSMGQNEATPPKRIQAVAAQALETIYGLNRQLVELHDMILPPTPHA